MSVKKFGSSYIREALGEFKTAFKTANKGNPAPGELPYEKQMQIIGKLHDTFNRHGGQMWFETFGEVVITTNDQDEIKRIGQIAGNIQDTDKLTDRLPYLKSMLDDLRKQANTKLYDYQDA